MDELSAEFEQAWVADFSAISPEARKGVARYLNNWLNTVAVKKPLPDLADRLTAWQKRIEFLADTAVLVLDRGQLVVKASGVADDTLRNLDRGSSWFEPCEGVRETMAALLMGTG